MDINKVFEKIAEKMMIDFQISADMQHHGNRGNAREDVLKKFLTQGRLPKQYSIGSGEIISAYSQSTKQTDLIIYDTNKSIIFNANESTQIFPIESVYGCIEVKSKLSKTKLLEGLENVKSLKEVYAPTTLSRKNNDNTVTLFETTPPFGIIFAYHLDKNSLQSLRTNLYEWCNMNPASVWPNLVCVLDEGILLFKDENKETLNSNEIYQYCRISAQEFKRSTLFEFTSRLISLCGNRQIEIFDINNYRTKGIIIDGLRVKCSFTDSSDHQYRLTDKFIKEIFNECKEKISHRELMEFRVGSSFNIHRFVSNNVKYFLYNPDNHLGFDDLVTKENNFSHDQVSKILNGITIMINEQFYYIPPVYLTADNFQAF